MVIPTDESVGYWRPVPPGHSFSRELPESLKLLILFQELILNAVKYSAFVKKDERFVSIQMSSTSNHISILVKNRFNLRKRARTTGIGHVVIENFAKLLQTDPVIKKDNDVYSVEITFYDSCSIHLWRALFQKPF